MKNKLVPLLTITAGLLTLCSCGSTTAPSAAPQTTLNTTPAASAASSEEKLSQDVLQLVNEVRRSGTINGNAAGGCVQGAPNLKALKEDSALKVAATGHARYTAEVGFEGHIQSQSQAPSFTGRELTDRVSASKSATISYAEVVAVGQRSAQEAVQAWVNSPTHCQALMRQFDTQAGISVQRGEVNMNVTPERYGVAWVMVMGH